MFTVGGERNYGPAMRGWNKSRSADSDKEGKRGALKN